MVRLGIVGYGYWGPNILRNFQSVKGVTIATICDASDAALTRASSQCPTATLTKNFRDITCSADIDAVAIITPASTHFEIAKSALQNKKHIFVEKPLTMESAHAKELIELAAKNQCILMVDHTFLFTEAVTKIKEIINSKSFGQVHYYDSMRVNLGLFQQDVNVIWDLAPHDFAIMDYVLNDKPIAIATHAMDHFNRGLENTAYVTVYFDHIIAHFNLNWLSPVKLRLTTIGGHNKMLLWDDLKVDEKIKVYDKGIVIDHPEKKHLDRVCYRMGDVWMPQLGTGEALNKEVNYFIDCIKTGKTPINDGEAGLRVVQLLEASEISRKSEGKLIKL